MTRRVHRRILLRGLGGACVAAPFLGSLADRSVQAAGPAAPRRFIVMFTHYGCITTRWFPRKSHGVLAATDLTNTTLEHLAPYVDKLLLPRGLRGMNQWTADLSLGQGNDQHLCACGSYFTCQPVTPNSDDPFSFDKATRFEAMPMGPSLDHVMAAQLSPQRAPFVLRPGNATDTPQSEVSYAAAGVPYAGYGLPSQAYSALTGLFQDGMPLNPDSYQALRGQSVIDLVRADLDTLERMDMSQADRDKLEAWKALLDDTGGVIASEQCTPTTAQALGATPELSDLVAGLPLGADSLATPLTGELDAADVYTNVAVLAAVCNANPVIVLKYPPNHVFSALGLDVESHALSHRIASAAMDGTCVSGWLDMLLTIDDYYSRKFARLVGLLDGIPEGDGRVLDNSAAIWFNEMSDGNAHNLNNLPIVQVGSCGGYFQTGVAINVEDGSATLSNGNSEGSCPTGTSIDIVESTGTDPGVANAPINKYFCNIMNALGVKAGPDGFPAVGGTAEVTHFGRYDRTEDFVGGGTNPPAIHSPGEYAALKASS